MSIQESAIAYHDNGFNCAQSVLAALQEETGLDESTAKRVAAGFGGGVRCGEICGSISGAVMAFGLAADQATATAMTKQMTQSFRAEFGCLRCQELVAKTAARATAPYDRLGRTARRGDPRREQSERITRKERKR